MSVGFFMEVGVRGDEGRLKGEKGGKGEKGEKGKLREIKGD